MLRHSPPNSGAFLMCAEAGASGGLGLTNNQAA